MNTNISIINTTLIISNASHHSDDNFMKESINRSANALKASSKDLKEKRRKWDYILNHGSDNQIMKSYFDLN